MRFQKDPDTYGRGHTSFGGVGALRAEISVLKAQICVCLQVRASTVWHNQIFEAHRKKISNSHDKI